jgi:protein phosphatase
LKIEIPELCLVVLIGPSGSGKSSFARNHFLPFETVSSDFCRGVVSNDENSLDATADAFELLHYIVGKRLSRGLLTVVDATNVQEESRKSLLKLAKDHDVFAVALALALPADLCVDRNRARPDRDFGPHVVFNQHRQMRRSLRNLKREGFRSVDILESPEQVDAAELIRRPLWNNRKLDHGPFDIIGDVHGCYDELVELLVRLGYSVANGAVTAPHGRKVILVGDLVDRGPKSVEVLKLAMGGVESGAILCVPGNHDAKLLRKLNGRDVQLQHGLEKTWEQLQVESEEFHQQVARFIDSLVSHYVLDDGKLVVAHAGLKEQYIGRTSGRVREFCLYGDTTGETDDFGLPVRLNWAADYRGPAHVVYGHTPVFLADWLNRTINIDTGCVFGGRLTALRWPEKEIVDVPAKQQYSVPSRPLDWQHSSGLSAQQIHDDVLDIDDVVGKRIIHTRLHSNLTIREENTIAALEVMSRFAVDPKWLIYLPPTMSPTETSKLPDYLEHPAEAFDYFRSQGQTQLICEEKHMGSRAIAVVCRDEDAALQRFGVRQDGAGIIYTRSGRRFFDDRSTEEAMLSRLRSAIDQANWWDRFSSNWFCLDCELMPWSAKAQELLRTQYAAVGAAGLHTLKAVNECLDAAVLRLGDVAKPLLSRSVERGCMLDKYRDAYRRYCWKVDSVDDLKLAPFHLLAAEGRVFTDTDHAWQMQTLAELSSHDPIFIATPCRSIDLNDEAAVKNATDWWLDLTGNGGEGMVVKPMSFVVRGAKGLVQPAMKVRGREYLRIIYGPEYTLPEYMDRLRKRGLMAKRSLALREFALGIEALHRFVERRPLRNVHECVFAVLALESEPVDPRL